MRETEGKTEKGEGREEGERIRSIEKYINIFM